MDAILVCRGNPGHQDVHQTGAAPGSVTGAERGAALVAVSSGARNKHIIAFNSSVSPTDLQGASWQDCSLTPAQYREKKKIAGMPRVQIAVTKGVETTVNALTKDTEKLLTPTDLNAVGGPGSKAGIQLLKAEEVAALGSLTTAEQDTLRKVINTRDVYPYAAITPGNADSVIYLAAPDSQDPNVSDNNIINTPFPADLPAIEQHLTRFKALLSSKTVSRGERRPWWSLHRPRPKVLSTLPPPTDTWSPFALTSRWGTGGSLIVGLAPRGVSPASGLHILRPENGISASYLAAIYNSTLFQALVAGIPPGQLRVDDLVSLGLPRIAGKEQELSDLGQALAQTVTDLVTLHSEHFPTLAATLRNELTLEDWPSDVWQPTPGPATAWGTLDTVAWLDTAVAGRSRTVQPDRVDTDSPITIFGHAIELKHENRTILTIHVTQGDNSVKDATAAALRAQVTRRATLNDIINMAMPTSPATLTTAWNAAIHNTQTLIDKYREDRAKVDAIIAGT
jgi:hypothetical protein